MSDEDTGPHADEKRARKTDQQCCSNTSELFAHDSFMLLLDMR